MAKSDPNLLTQAEYARSRKDRGLPGGSREAVRKAVDEGRISAFGPDKLVDRDLADSQWERNTRARVSQQAASAPGTQLGIDAEPPTAQDSADAAGSSKASADPSYMAFRARREEADAQMAEMNVAKMRGAMLNRQDVDRAMFEIGRELRDQLMSGARRIAAEVASKSTAEECEEVIDREHRIVLELLVTSFREKIGSAAKVTA